MRNIYIYILNAFTDYKIIFFKDLQESVVTWCVHRAAQAKSQIRRWYASDQLGHSMTLLFDCDLCSLCGQFLDLNVLTQQTGHEPRVGNLTLYGFAHRRPVTTALFAYPPSKQKPLVFGDPACMR